MVQKKLQKNSKLNPLDKNQDGIIDDHELEVAETETKLRKHLAQLRMARYSLIAMGAFTLAMFFVPIERVNALADISNLFYLTGGGIVSVYMGASMITKGGK